MHRSSWSASCSSSSSSSYSTMCCRPFSLSWACILILECLGRGCLACLECTQNSGASLAGLMM